MTWLHRIWPWGAAVFSGILLALSFPPADQSWLAWIALTPLICALWLTPEAQGKARHRRPALLGFVTGLVFFYLTFFWMTHVTALGWFALCPYLALYPALWGWVVGALLRPGDKCVTDKKFPDGKPVWLSSRRNLAIACLAAFVWVAQEWLRGIVFTGLGWNGLGVALHANLPMIQIAEFTGVGGISFLLVVINVIAVQSIKRLTMEAGQVSIRPHYDFSLSMVLVVGVFTFGIKTLQHQPPTLPLRVAAVQPNVPQNQKWDPAFESEILARYQQLSEVALAAAPQLLLWPESAIPGGLFGTHESHRFLTDIAKLSDANFIFGTINFDQDNDYNAAAMLSERGSNVQIYNKMHLVPFGEFIPFRHSFPLFAWIAGDLLANDFSPGLKPVIFTLAGIEEGEVRAAPLVCFEDTVARHVRKFAPLRANLLVNITNDGWFYHSSASAQHLNNALFRSVENRIPMIRAANTGVSCIIDPFGNITSLLSTPEQGTFVEGTLSGQIQIPRQPTPTFFMRYGDAFSVLAVIITAMIILIQRPWCQPSRSTQPSSHDK